MPFVGPIATASERVVIAIKITVNSFLRRGCFGSFAFVVVVIIACFELESSSFALVELDS